jgi:SMODS-associating 2TM, beta-strand rich effector domain
LSIQLLGASEVQELIMTNVRQEASEWIRVVVLVTVWSTLLYLSKIGLVINWDSVKQLPTVITIYATLSYVFTRWLWRMPLLRGWLVPFPDLQGTWQGEIITTWKDPQIGPSGGPIPVILVIRQNFSSIWCTMHSINSDSRSTAAQLNFDADGTVRLTYNYTNRPKATVRDQMAMHDGAAILRLVLRPRRTLEGEYWTNRRSIGDISVKFRSRALLEEVPG